MDTIYDFLFQRLYCVGTEANSTVPTDSLGTGSITHNKSLGLAALGGIRAWWLDITAR
jgi:hypothetical protein